MRSRDIVRTWLLSDPYPSPLKGSQHKDSPHTITRTVSEISMASSQASPVSEVFTNSSLPDDSASDTSSMMGSCILDNELPFKCLQDKTDRGPGCERGTQHDVGIQAQLQVGLCTSVPLTPANLQHYMDSYVKRPKHKPQRSRPKPSEPPEPKSGWARMLESTRKMEHETAIKMEQERRNGNEFAKWRSAMMPWM
ncbi:hypothetical protein FRC06_005356 [Ceratobasidium sp. 370]|nr:hypothetical protein FRC06_005356 [Ceratobasidium sp. 370]